MLTSHLLGAVALAVGVNAQAATPTTGSGASSVSAPSSTASANIIDIAVGAENHKFVPDQVNASVGDIIRFNFYPGGHRVARAEFGYPCIPYEYTGPNKIGFWSGVFSPQVITNPPPSYEVRVNDTKPIFFYCGAPGSCIQYGMVGVINPTAEFNLTYQKALALNSTLQLTPGEPFPSETLSIAPTPTATSVPKTDPGQSNGGGNGTVPQQTSGDSGGLGAGAIAGIVIGAAAVLILGAALVYMCGRRGGFETAYRKSMHHGMPPTPGAPGMVENKFLDPKSPGQATMSTFPNVERDPYRVSAQSGHGAFSGTPPPMHSPGMPGYGNYQTPMAAGVFPTGAQTHQPLGFHAGQTSPHPAQASQFQSPIELPSAEQPIKTHSPPPQYPKVDRSDSQTTGGDSGYYHPSKP